MKTNHNLFRLTLFVSLILGSLVHSQTGNNEPRFKTFHTGQAFTSITSDANKNVWAGTTSQGIFFLNQTQQNPIFTTQVLGTGPVIGSTRMQSMARDQSGNIWIGHGGINSTNGQGGLEKVNVNTLAVQHFSPDRDARGFQFFQRDGIATLNVQQVIVDPNNKVWTAHRYHDLTVSGPPSSQYILTPGTFSTRNANDSGPFVSFNTWQDRLDNTMIGGLPYPAYTYNPPISVTPDSRTVNAISVDRGFIYISVFGYNDSNGVFNSNGNLVPTTYLKPRLIKYTNTEIPQFVEDYSTQEAQFNTSGVIFHGVYSNKNKGVWVTTPVAGNGFSVWVPTSSDINEGNGLWYNVTDPRIVPPGTIFNKGAIWGDSAGRVFMGTNKGIIVYKGSGEVQSPYSYTLFTKDINNPPIERAIHDPLMLSNNITAGCIESESTEEYSWIATASGIMRLNLPIGDALVYHVEDKEQPFKEKINGNDNYAKIKTLLSTHISIQYDLGIENEIPSFAVDGTKSSVLRIKTNDPEGYYAPNSIYRIELRKSTSSTLPGNPNSQEYIDRYGKFFLKPLADYEGQPQVQDLKFVDYIYEHPKYIEQSDFVTNKNYTEYDIFVFKRTPQQTDETKFRHPIKLCLPPVLFGHGVWSDVSSVENFEKYFKTRGYTEYETIKAWRVNKSRPENPFEVDADIIPKYIKALISKAIGGNVSAGKVNVIVHSRGGLYTRAYIEELSTNPKNKYNNDINALVTLNTPHFGSQAANLILDQRIIIPSVRYPVLNSNIDFQTLVNLDIINFESTEPLRIGNIFEKFGPASNDKPTRYGTKNLTVVNDVLSQKDNNETRFIGELNQPNNVSKMNGIPIHAVATTINICQVDPIFCNDLFGTPNAPIKIPKIASWALIITKIADFALNNVPAGLNNLLSTIYNGPNDGIVPVESMRAGLTNPLHISSFVGQQIAHIYTEGFPNTSGVTENSEVQGTVFGKLKEKLNAVNGSFSNNGINPTNLTYNFLPSFTGLSARESQVVITKKIVIDPNSFDQPLAENQMSTFKIYQENLDQIFVVIDFENDKTYSYTLEKNSNLTFANTFSFTTPLGNYGKVTITAYGISDGKLASEHTITSSIQLPQSITLQSIRFEDDNVSMDENSTYKFNLLGTFSDNIERKINFYPGITYEISNSESLLRTDSETVKSLLPGQCKLKALIGTLNSKIDFIITNNSALQETIVTDYFSNFQSSGPITLKWNTFWEYRSKKFILESSSDNLNFTQINEQLGLGTNYNPYSYSYIDNTTSSLIYYRLRLLNIDDVEVYSQTILVNRAPLSIQTFKNNDKIKIYPNPLLASSFSIDLGKDAVKPKITIYNMNGSEILTLDKLEVINGKIIIQLPYKFSEGIYFVQIKTNEFVKTEKLIIQN